MSIAVPIKELKETKKFSKLVNDNDEVLVTKNGYSDFHCVSAKKREAKKIKNFNLALEKCILGVYNTPPV